MVPQLLSDQLRCAPNDGDKIAQTAEKPNEEKCEDYANKAGLRGTRAKVIREPFVAHSGRLRLDSVLEERSPGAR